MKPSVVVLPLLSLMVACSAATPSPRTVSRPEVEQKQQPRVETRADTAAAVPDIEQRVRMAMVVPVEKRRLVPASGGSPPCAVSIGVTDLGGVSVSYRAAPGQQQELRAAVHVMAARHNERVSQSPAVNDRLAILESGAKVGSIAVVEETTEGARVVLVPKEAWELPELYSHIEVHAPDLLPAPLRAKRCPIEPLGPR
jgi:hypothetical protein